MNLGQLRKKFIEVTGRYDLMQGTAEEPKDGGSDFIINSGQRLLDDMQTTPKSLAWFKKDIATGDVGLQVIGLRYINEVWIANADGEVEINKKSLSWILTNYPTPLSGLTQAQPVYYAPAVLNLAPTQQGITSEVYSSTFTYAYEHVMFADKAEEGNTLPHYDGIVLAPPSNATYTISILGAWYSRELLKDEDSSFWTVRHPDLLIRASMLELEGYNRNSQGYRDLESVVAKRLSLIDANLAMQEAAKATQMGG